jgi:hypothetical protein
MIMSGRERRTWAYRSLRECPVPPEANVDITLFANYYGTVEDSHRFNDPSLYTDKPWYNRLMNEMIEMKIFRRNKKHA